jgi:outer membrane cobalamin receptor
VRFRRSLFVLPLLLFCITRASAQAPATLRGTLSDPSGAAIAGARVIATRVPLESSPGASAITSSDGRYELPLAPGRWRVRIDHTSFARAEAEFTFAAGEQRDWSPRLPLERLAAEVLVTAQAEPLVSASVSSPSTVLTRSELTDRQEVWLTDSLQSTPGIAVARLGRAGGITTLFLDGGNSNFTKLLVDGVPANEPGGSLNFSSFTLDNFEKVEVIHGASSALFGTDAMVGVIQAFTRRGSTATPHLELLAEGGSFETGRGSAHLSGMLGRFDYAAAAARYQTSGQGPNDFFRNTTLSGNFGWLIADQSQLRLTLRSNASDAGVPGQTSLIPLDPDHHNAFRDFSAGLAWDFSSGPRWRHRLAGYDFYIRQLFDDPSSDFCLPTPPFPCDFSFTARNQFNRAGVQAQSSYLRGATGFTLGYHLDIENGFFGGEHGRRNNQGGYLEARHQFGPRLTVVAGARAEANASFGTRVVPRVGAAYALRLGSHFWGPTRLKFSYGLGIKEPSLSQSFAQDTCFPGNGGLRPERSRSFHYGADQFIAGERIRLSVDGFHNQFRDIVSFAFGQFPGAPPPPATCPFGFGSFFNTDLARARGVNTSVEARPARWLRLAGHYSYVDSRVLRAPNAFDPALQPGNRLLHRPPHSGSISLNAEVKRMNWNLNAVFVGEATDSDFLGFGLTRNPGYARVDLAAHYRLQRAVTLFARIENLFGDRYEEAIGFPAYGRHFRLGMKLALGGE